MDANLLITLQNYGFSEKEARVYLTVLELGTSIASTIARRAELNRVTTYTLLSDMKKKGYIDEVVKNNIKYYSAVKPEILLERVENRYMEFKEKLPEFVSLNVLTHGMHAKIFEGVELFEGLEGLKKMYNRLLYTQEPIHSFLGTDEALPELKSYLYDEFVPKRMKKKILTKVILSVSPGNTQYIKKTHNKYTQVLVVDKHDFTLANEINIYGNDKVSFVMFNAKEKYGLIVHSKRLHDNLLNIFNLLRLLYEKNGTKKTK